MPVLVTAPETSLGEEVVRRLAATGGQVRAFGSHDAPAAFFRQMGAIVATGSLLDEGHLETAMEQVHTVVHLAVSPLADSAAQIVEEFATVVSASLGAGVRRLVTLSVPGARTEAGDPLRQAAAEVEELVAAAPVPATVVRASLVDSEDLRTALARVPMDRTTLDNPVAPVAVSDLADLLLWLDDQRARSLPNMEILAADGPEVVPLSGYLRSVGVTPLSAVGRVVERLRPSDSRPGLLADALAGPWTSGREVTSAWARSGLSPGPAPR